MKTLDEIEARLRSLVEVHLVKYIPGYKPEDQVAHLLAAAMYKGLVRRGTIIRAPNIFTITAHPSTLTNWNAEPQLLEELANALYKTGTEAGYRFSNKLRVITSSNVNMEPGKVDVQATIRTGPLSETRGVPATEIGKEGEGKDDAVPPNAFLILGGTKILPLTYSVINIGRRLDNHIVIDDPRVSRAHAQLRTVKGRFVLFDLESTGGTFVNGKRTKQTVLYPGDVVSLAGVTLIFGQDIPSGRNLDDQTEPGSPVSAERPTAHLKSEDEPE
jgi:FHA domain/FhaA, N-terminal domain